jgi:acyl-CoA thioesterase FadM
MAMPVVHAEIDYLRPLLLSDRVTVELRLVDTGRRSIRFEATYRDEGGEPAAIARTVHVITDRGLPTASIPDWLLRAVEPTTPEEPK